MCRTKSASPLSLAQQVFAREQLPFPPLPDPLAARLQATRDVIFATRELDCGPYHLQRFTAEMLNGLPPDDYAILGFDGHGTNSWAVHYFLVQPGIALFMQWPWGGAYDNPDEGRAIITKIFQWAEAVQRAVERGRRGGQLSNGWRLAVVHSALSPCGWGWVPDASPGQDAITWHNTADALNEAASALLDVINGKTTLA